MLHVFTFNPFSENTYILVDESSREALLFDPGCYGKHECLQLQQWFEEHNIRPVRLLLTHAHIDHILGNAFVFEQYGLQPWLHEKDLADLQRLVAYAPVFGIEAEASPEPAGWLKHGETIEFGGKAIELREAPGHSAGSICFINHTDGYLIGGDVLFAGSIGRTDLPGGNLNTLLASVREQLFSLPNDYTVYPGHGPATTIGDEKRHNPFFQ